MVDVVKNAKVQRGNFSCALVLSVWSIQIP